MGQQRRNGVEQRHVDQRNAELERVRKDGYALDREEITRGLMCVAAPIFDAQGEIAGAMSCTFQSYISGDRGIEPEIESVLRYSRAASGLNS